MPIAPLCIGLHTLRPSRGTTVRNEADRDDGIWFARGVLRMSRENSMNDTSFGRRTAQALFAATLLLLASCGSDPLDEVCVEGTCNQVCEDGDCSLGCEAGADCDADCAGGGCEYSCTEESDCEVDCDGGGCSLTCEGTADCDFDCLGGGCSFTCSEGADCEGSCGEAGGCSGNGFD